ncbi:hypothetical protein PF005_g1383 [Phytophthora fragariae]|uniref:Myb-related protein B n=1 Tax=Phytophthora fragariae TaxID=53985 RepID=A0A6A3FX38_9STRA|nr:hypothetical protein PF003_g20868 [Phytophthora fragariae]KAE8949031.1 hypothetical protein PF009_g1376 [Phytophthora fragariae]KAE9029897.1 hypothetical protein PF011_g846 [Phytophthora fragariae]KAE9138528.1 hypothetical protein PF007_g1384 [Phytophthora fragariae]KAE9154885.1 hypothetical protein PF006_g1084 [Phytophthora fragariae]
MELRYSPYRKKNSRKPKATNGVGDRPRNNNKWTPEEDSLLRDGVCKFGGKKWSAISELIADRSPEDCNKRWNKLQSFDTVVKRPWTEAEDVQMLNLVRKYGATKWAVIASYLPDRNGKQCRERWHNQLNPAIKKTPWTEQEDATIVRLQAQLGNSWAKITSHLSGRTDNAVKNHWYSSLKSVAKLPSSDAAWSQDGLSAPRKKSKKKSRRAKARGRKKVAVKLQATASDEVDEVGEDSIELLDLIAPVSAPSDDSPTTSITASVTEAAKSGSLSPDSVSNVENLGLYAQSYKDGMLRAQAVIDNVLDPMGMGGTYSDNYCSLQYDPDTCVADMTPGFSISSWSASDDELYCYLTSNDPRPIDPTSPAQPPFGWDELLYDSLYDVCGNGGLQTTATMESSGWMLSTPLSEAVGTSTTAPSVPLTIDDVKREAPPLECCFVQEFPICTAPQFGVEL